jgi:putative ABC transport system permease protein
VKPDIVDENRSTTLRKLSILRRLSTRLSSLFRRARYERELDTELSFHLDMLTEQHLRAGMAPVAARQAAVRTFGVVDRVKDDVRDTWLSRVAETMGQDVRYGIRSLRRNPGFAVVVIVTMALGIGANTAIFSVVNGVLLKPLPYKNGESLVVLHQQQPLAGVEDMGFSFQEILDYRAARSIDAVVEFHEMYFILLGLAEPQRVGTGVVSANFFDVLGVKPLFGRAFVAADDSPGAPAVLMLSYKYWQRAFGGDPSVVGRIFRMNDRPHQVVGILPPVPRYPSEVDVYMPTSACPFRSSPAMIDTRAARMVTAFARIRDEVQLSKARADLDLVAARMESEHPADYPKARGFRVVAVPLREELTRSFRTTLLVLLGTAGFVLLIVCASVANLMLARMVRREREVAIRGALGAGRSRLLRQLLTESTLLALAGGLVGLALARWGVTLLVVFVERFTPRAAEITIDHTVLAYTFIVSVATGIVFGSAPALNGSLSIAPSMNSGSRTTERRPTLRNALIVLQVAASFMLLIGAGLTIRSLVKLQQVDPGFTVDNILTFRIDLNFTKYSDAAKRGQLWHCISEQLKTVPGVGSVGGAGTFPLNEQAPFSQSLLIRGREDAMNDAHTRVDVRLATPNYFDTIGQPIVSGRTFGVDEPVPGGQPRPGSADDNDRQVGSVIVNQSLARHYWPGQNPIGQLVSGNGGRTWSSIIGVVADARQQLRDPVRDELYLPLFQSRQLSTNWLVHTAVDAEAMARQIRSAIHAIDPDQPVENFRTLAEVRSSSLASPTVTATLLGLFGLLALVITAAGIAGVVAFSVNQRTQEFGIRMALGAARTNVLGMVLRQGLKLVALGLGLGVVGALILTQVLTTLLFDVRPNDGITYIAVSLALLLVALGACFVPARRAASVDPMVALRVG